MTRRQTPAQAERRRERDRVNKALARAAPAAEVPDEPRRPRAPPGVPAGVPRPAKRLAGPGGLPGRAAGMVRCGDRRRRGQGAGVCAGCPVRRECF